MSIGKMIPVILQVLQNKTIIITAVIIFVYMDIVCYIVRYKKKPKKVKTKSVAAPPPAAEAPAPEGGGEAAE